MHKLITPIAAAGVLMLGIYSARATDKLAAADGLGATPGTYGTSTAGPYGTSTIGTYGTSGTSTIGPYGTSTTGNFGTSGVSTTSPYGTTGITGGTTSGTSTAATTSTATKPTAKGGGPSMTGQSCTMDEAHKTAAVLQFLHEANLAEIKEGSLAPARASSAEVKTYASDLVTAHADADKKLAALAKKKGFDLTRSRIDDPIRAAVLSASDASSAALGGKTGKAFDTAFVAPEVHEHTLALKVVDEGLKVTKDAEVKALLTDVRAALVKHQQRASKLQDQLVMGTATTGTGGGIGGGPESDVTMPGTKRPDPTKSPKGSGTVGK